MYCEGRRQHNEQLLSALIKKKKRIKIHKNFILKHTIKTNGQRKNLSFLLLFIMTNCKVTDSQYVLILQVCVNVPVFYI